MQFRARKSSISANRQEPRDKRPAVRHTVAMPVCPVPPPTPIAALPYRLFLATLMALALAGNVRAADPAPAADPGIDHAMLDPAISPCQDFYRFSCGGWIAANPIPPHESSWRVDQLLERRVDDQLRAILEKAASQPTNATRRLGDYYATCLDENAIEAAGTAPLNPQLAHIEGMTDKQQLPALIAALHRAGIDALFAFGAGQDAKDAESIIAIADEGGTGLPDRDDYMKADAPSNVLRRGYVHHIARMFQLLGESEDRARTDSETVMRIETALAKGQLDRVSRRNPQLTYHRISRADLDALTPSFDWDAYLHELGAPALEVVDVTEEAFFKTVDQVVQATALDDLKIYLRWRLLNAAARWLPQAFVREDFAFHGRRLTGVTENRPRWKRCLGNISYALMDDLGRAYAAEAFPPEARQRTQTMVDAIAGAFEDNLKTLDWMGADTRGKALAKLALLRKKLGYPDKWRDYDTLGIKRGDMLGNAQRIAAFDVKREMNKIGKPVNRGEWMIAASTVNAYYDAQMNDINLPAGILQPPFFSEKFDDAVNFGATGGSTVGHEMTHAFDDEGRQYDGHGNLTDWWTAEDAARFRERARCVAEQYSGYDAVPGLKVNGELTLGENVADLGGARLGYMALMKLLAGRTPPPVGGFTAAQRYFIAYAQSWCGSTRPETVTLHTRTDPHAPPEYRVNGVVSDMPEFRQAFSCKAGDPMVREQSCRVW